MPYGDDDLEMLRQRIAEKVKTGALRDAPDESGDLGLKLAAGGIDALSRYSNAGLDPAEILTGIKQPRSAGVTNAAPALEAAQLARATRARQAALDDVTSLSSIQKLIDAKKDREEKNVKEGWARSPDGSLVAVPDGKAALENDYLKSRASYLKHGGSSAGKEDQGTKTKRTVEGGLRKEYQNLDAVKDFQKVGAAYQTVAQAAKDPSPAGDLSLIFGYMKMLDPGSTVREGEFANAQNAASVPDQVRNQWNKVLNGERLNPDQRLDFVNQAKGLYDTRVKTKKQVDERYSKLAAGYGAEATNVVDPTDYTPAAPSADPTIQGYADTHKLSYAQAEAILRNRGYGR